MNLIFRSGSEMVSSRRVETTHYTDFDCKVKNLPSQHFEIFNIRDFGNTWYFLHLPMVKVMVEVK